MKTKPMILGWVLLIATGAWAGTETVLYSFAGGHDGAYGGGRPVLDGSSALYGTTLEGGTCGNGTVFKLSSDGTKTVLYDFCGSDGDSPFGDVILDPSGAIYGTTEAGGGGNCGTVWKLSGSTLTTLHSFTCGNDGGDPEGGVIRDERGNLYGTAQEGGTSNDGVAYEISASGTFSVIHSFCPLNCVHRLDGAVPNGLAVDAAGNLYGTTVYGGDFKCDDGGGDYGCGTVFEISRSGRGWKERVLHSFHGEGMFPLGGPTLATRKSGGKKRRVIFGDTSGGGGTGDGIVFQMIESKNGGYKFKVLHTFNGRDGASPVSALTVVKGNLYGTTPIGGNPGAGVVFRLKKSGKTWIETVLYNFTGGSDGQFPVSEVADSNGNLYGETQGGGSDNCFRGCGVVYAVTP